jgi:hypothetical protein
MVGLLTTVMLALQAKGNLKAALIKYLLKAIT